MHFLQRTIGTLRNEILQKEQLINSLRANSSVTIDSSAEVADLMDKLKQVQQKNQEFDLAGDDDVFNSVSGINFDIKNSGFFHILIKITY